MPFPGRVPLRIPDIPVDSGTLPQSCGCSGIQVLGVKALELRAGQEREIKGIQKQGDYKADLETGLRLGVEGPGRGE